MEFILQNWDTIFKIGAIALGAYGFLLSLRNEIKHIATDMIHIKDNMKRLEEAFNQLGSILTKVAVQDTRLNMIEKKLDELSHGMGFVKIQGNNIV